MITSAISNAFIMVIIILIVHFFIKHILYDKALYDPRYANTTQIQEIKQKDNVHDIRFKDPSYLRQIDIDADIAEKQNDEEDDKELFKENKMNKIKADDGHFKKEISRKMKELEMFINGGQGGQSGQSGQSGQGGQSGQSSEDVVPHSTGPGVGSVGLDPADNPKLQFRPAYPNVWMDPDVSIKPKEQDVYNFILEGEKNKENSELLHSKNYPSGSFFKDPHIPQSIKNDAQIPQHAIVRGEGTYANPNDMNPYKSALYNTNKGQNTLFQNVGAANEDEAPVGLDEIFNQTQIKN